MLKSSPEPDSQPVGYTVRSTETDAQEREKNGKSCCVLKFAIVKNVISNEHASETQEPPSKRLHLISDSGVTHR